MLTPVAYIESCRAPERQSTEAAVSPPLLSPAERRPEAKTYLTYPEWHIVYEAEAYARHLAAGRPPSTFDYGNQIDSFWTSYCAVNRLTSNSAAAGEAKLTIYTIGISFTLELAVKAAYERTIGRLFEWASGWTSADDAFAARVQARYRAFLHETPWYRFPFAAALTQAWTLHEPRLHARHWERRFASSAEFGVKALYAKVIDAATGATVGRDETTLRLVARATPDELSRIDTRMVPIRRLTPTTTVVQAPRYQQFSDLLAKLSATPIQLVEIAGNRTIMMSVLLPTGITPPASPLLDMPIDRPGWRRVGMAVPVPELLALMRKTRAAGGLVEHVYDY